MTGCNNGLSSNPECVQCGECLDVKQDKFVNGKWKKRCSKCRVQKPPKQKSDNAFIEKPQPVENERDLTRTIVGGLSEGSTPTSMTTSEDEYCLRKHDQIPHTLSILALPIRLRSPSLTHVSESFAQQALFDLTNSKVKPDVIVTEIVQYRNQGKPLSWFQDVIPELCPGVEGNAIWLENARENLWSMEMRIQHEGIRNRTKLLRQKLPDLPLDVQNLRRYWPVLIDSLKPMTVRTAGAVDEVSCAIGRDDCQLLDHSQMWIVEPTETPVPPQEFVAVRQAMQDKVLSPMIDDNARQISRLKAELLAGGSEFLSANPVEMIKSSQPNDHNSRMYSSYSRLQAALRRLRSIIIDEKDTADKLTLRKRDCYQDLEENKIEGRTGKTPHKRIRGVSHTDQEEEMEQDMAEENTHNELWATE